MADAPAAPATPAPASNAVLDAFDADQTTHIEDIFDFGVDKPAPAANSDDGGAAVAEPSVGAEGGEGGGDPESSPPEPSPKPPVAKEPKAAEPPAPVEPDPRDLELTALKAQMAEMQKKLEAPAPAAEPAPSGEPTPAPAAEGPPPVNFKLPDQMKQMLASENPEDFHQVIEGIVSGVTNHANTLVHQLAQHVQVLKNEIETLKGGEAPNGATPTGPAAEAVDAAKTAKEQQEQYYTKFPAHKEPTYLPVIQSAMQELMREFPGHPWDDNFMNALGTRVQKRVSELAALVTPPKVPALLQPGARSAAPGAGGGDDEDPGSIWDD